MFIGHYALGFAAKKAAPTVSLGTLFMAVQWLDLLWPTFLLLGWEEVVIDPGNTAFTPLHFTHYPISHSLLSCLGWSLFLGGTYWLFTKKGRAALLVGLAVLSHWFLDFIVHAPDLPFGPGEEVLLGLGLWNLPALTFLLEGTLYLTGLILYWRSTLAHDSIGRYGFWGLAILLLIFYLGNAFSPPPPNVAAIAWVSQSLWLIVLLAWWVDRHRRPNTDTPAALQYKP